MLRESPSGIWSIEMANGLTEMLDVTDRTVVITGGATGIGFGLAMAFGARGANVVIGEPRQARLDEAIMKLSDSDIKARAIPMDVTDPKQLSDFAG